MANPGSGSQDGGQQPHLYLLLDDSMWGCGIYKLDLASDWDSDDVPAELPPLLPRHCCALSLPPAIFRLESHPQIPGHATAAFGKIISLPPKVLTDSFRPFATSGSILVLDVQKREVTLAPDSKGNLFLPMFIPLADKLFVLSFDSSQTLVLQTLVLPAPDSTPVNRGFWSQLPKPPFSHARVSSYGVYADKKTIFVSVIRDFNRNPAIFTLNTETPSQWQRKQSDSKKKMLPFLPFRGQAHFDSRMQAWVGRSREDPRCICVCDAEFLVGSSYEVSMEGLFSDELDESSVGIKLVHMEDRNKFCIVESVYVDKDSDGRELDVTAFLFRVATFSLKRDMNGKLVIGSLRVRYYKLPQPVYVYSMTAPVAFWM